jgi:hypothetical protein
MWSSTINQVEFWIETRVRLDFDLVAELVLALGMFPSFGIAWWWKLEEGVHCGFGRLWAGRDGKKREKGKKEDGLASVNGTITFLVHPNKLVFQIEP